MADKPRGLERLGRAIQKSLQFFQKKPTTDPKLAGRIHEISRTAKEVLNELLHIRIDLQTRIDPELFLHVEAVIDPLIKDITRILKILDEEPNPAQQVQVFKRYTISVEKANSWIQIKHRGNDKDTIEKAVVDHILHEFFERIERDLQVINDYQRHMLESLPLDDEERGRLWVELEQKIGSYIKSLLALKRAPNPLSIQRLTQWKRNVDQRRSKYFDGALHAIDNLVNAYSPDSPEVEEHDHLIEIFTRMATLEEETTAFWNEIGTIDLKDPDVLEECEYRLAKCEDEVSQLNLDLRLTPELIDRLQVIIDTLTTIRFRLN